MSRPDTSHECPGCGQSGVPRHHLACKPCWCRLPDGLRDAINGSFHARTRAKRPDDRSIAVRAYRRALTAALSWFRDNRTEAQRA